jgi:hypothetical protein
MGMHSIVKQMEKLIQGTNKRSQLLKNVFPWYEIESIITKGKLEKNKIIVIIFKNTHY